MRRPIVVLLAVAVALFFGWSYYTSGTRLVAVALAASPAAGADSDSLVVAACKPDALPSTLRCHLAEEVRHLRQGHNDGAFFWSALYHVCLLGALILTAASAYLAKFDVSPVSDSASAIATAKQQTDKRRTRAATFAAIAALLTAVSAAGGFNGKWKANRDARARLDTVRIDLQDPSVSLSAVRDSVRAIIRDENGAINAAATQ
jgi:hypothetical protein